MGTDEAEQFYDCTAAIWAQTFGEHVHVGYYPNGRSSSSSSRSSWRHAQYAHIDALVELAGVHAAKRLLDVGCGFGGTAVHLVKKLPGCSAIGINISGFQVEAGKQLAARQGLKQQQVDFQVADALDPPFPDGSFDLVLSLESSTYMPDKSKFIAQLARLCAPGGKVILADFHRCYGGQLRPRHAAIMSRIYGLFSTQGEWATPEQHRQLMAQHGLKVVTLADWTPKVRPFWCVGILELMLQWGSDQPRSLPARLVYCLKRLLHCIYLILTGGLAALRMTLTFMTPVPRLVAEQGMREGAFGYYVLVAQKPLTTTAGAAAAGGGGELAAATLLQRTGSLIKQALGRSS